MTITTRREYVLDQSNYEPLRLRFDDDGDLIIEQDDTRIYVGKVDAYEFSQMLGCFVREEKPA